MAIGVKICGVNSADAFDAAVEAGANWIGFVFYRRSPRAVTPAEAASLSARVTGGPLRTGLFVSPTQADIAAVLEVIPLDILQIYAETKEVEALAPTFGLPVWRAMGVSTSADLPAAAGAAAALVIESRPPPGATRPGGNATAFDWGLLAGWRPPFDWLLAGGLTPSNVRAAIVESGASAVDVSSGVETAPGRKSPALIRSFIEAARSQPQ